MNTEYNKLLEMLRPRRKQSAEVAARLRPLLIVNSPYKGEGRQPSPIEVKRVMQRIKTVPTWLNIFDGIATMSFDPINPSLSMAVHMTKNEGVAVRKMQEDDAEGYILKEIDYHDKWSFNEPKLIEKTGIKQGELRALIYCLDIKSDHDCYKEWKVNSIVVKNYSQKAVQRLREEKGNMDMQEVRTKYKNRNRV